MSCELRNGECVSAIFPIYNDRSHYWACSNCKNPIVENYKREPPPDRKPILMVRKYTPTSIGDTFIGYQCIECDYKEVSSLTEDRYSTTGPPCPKCNNLSPKYGEKVETTVYIKKKKQPERHSGLGPIPAGYVGLLPGLTKVAREYGYALGLHGSLQNDLDLIAVPWVEGARPAEEMIKAMAEKFAWLDPYSIDGPEEKPHGRRAWCIGIGMAGARIDISITTKDDEQLKKKIRELEAVNDGKVNELVDGLLDKIAKKPKLYSYDSAVMNGIKGYKIEIDSLNRENRELKRTIRKLEKKLRNR